MPSAHSSRPLARMKSAPLLYPPDARAASVDSDKFVPSTSHVLINPTAFRFDLEKAFPAILAPFSLLQKIPESQDINALRALAPVFSNCLDTILHSMSRFPEQIPTSPKYHLALSGVVFSRDTFLGHVSRIIHPGRSSSRQEAIHIAMQLLDIVMSSLRGFLNVAAYEAAQLKPLPRIPVEDNPGPGGQSATSSSYSHSSSSDAYIFASHSMVALDQPRRRKVSALFRPFHRVTRRPSCLDLTGLDSPTSNALIDNDLDDLERGYVHVSIKIRNSLAQFPVSIDSALGASHPEDDTELLKDRNGLAQLASLKALVRYMTSPDADSDVEIVDVFFLCFRFFSSPKDTFDALISRFDENLACQSPSIMESLSLQVKMRIARLLYLWVELHWRAEDAEVLKPLTRFAFSRLAQEIPREAYLKLISSLHQRACAGEQSRGLRKEKTVARAEAKYRQELLSSSWEPREKRFMMRRDFSRVKLEHFHSPGGCTMLALQMTLLLWEKYRAFEPEDAVRYLMTRSGDDGPPMSDVARQVANFMAYERAVHRLALNSIGSAESVQKRTELTEFFLELATKCHELRNYSASCLIALACDRPSVLPFITKLKLSSTHEQMKTVLRDFYTQENHHMAGYKQALQRCCCPALPGMMLFIQEIARGCGSGPYDQHPSFPGSRLINLKRYRPITWAVRAMEKCHAPFKIQRVDYICDWLEHVLSEYLVGSESEWEERIYNKCRQQ